MHTSHGLSNLCTHANIIRIVQSVCICTHHTDCPVCVHMHTSHGLSGVCTYAHITRTVQSVYICTHHTDCPVCVHMYTSYVHSSLCTHVHIIRTFQSAYTCIHHTDCPVCVHMHTSHGLSSLCTHVLARTLSRRWCSRQGNASYRSTSTMHYTRSCLLCSCTYFFVYLLISFACRLFLIDRLVYSFVHLFRDQFTRVKKSP